MKLILIASFFLIALHACVAQTALPGAWSQELSGNAYDITLSVLAAKTLTATGAVHIMLEKSATVWTEILLTRNLLTVQILRAKQPTVAGSVKVSLASGQTIPIQIMRCGSWLCIAINQQTIFRQQVSRLPGTGGGAIATGGWKIISSEVQSLEPVVFAADFMRGDQEGSSQWTYRPDEWALCSAWSNEHKVGFHGLDYAETAQNPFSWVNTNRTGSTICTTGQAFWEDYTMTVAVKPAEGGSVGTLVNMPDTSQGILARWSAADDKSSTGNRLQLLLLHGGKRTILAESPGGYLPGQWYKFTIISTPALVQVLIDGQERLQCLMPALWRGGVGLYAEVGVGGGAATFDDVTVYGHSLDTDLLTERQEQRQTARFMDDRDMKSWTKAQNDWTPSSKMSGYQRYRWFFYGDQWMTLTFTPSNAPQGILAMVLNGNDSNAHQGYRVVISYAGIPHQYDCTLFYNENKLASANCAPFPAGKEVTLRFWHVASKVWLECNGETLLQASNVAPVTDVQPAYYVDGCFAAVRDVLMLGKNQLNYVFANAPTDWIGEGTWQPSIRWSCAPQFSFLAGWSRGDVTLWHKKRFSGDQVLQAFVGIKMEYPREQAIYEERYRDMGITICGDGHDPRSGYSVIFGAADGYGNNRRTVLLRNGKIVTTSSLYMPEKQYGHHAWLDLSLTKQGNVITFQMRYLARDMWNYAADPGHMVTGTMSYTDNEPLNSGIPAVWSQNNGISVARVRMLFANPPQLVAAPRIILGSAWYPEWADIGRALTISFPKSWSTSGKPVHLVTTSIATPKGDEDALKVQQDTTTFTPKAPGEHWYQITAEDNEGHRSFPFHLNLQVFNPDRGRDDTHAILLYRFDEGKGNIIHDVSPIGPAANLLISKEAEAGVSWLPQQGLQKIGAAAPVAKDAAQKLMTLVKTKACTIEFWVSALTADPPSDSYGFLFSWDNGQVRNLSIVHFWYTLLLSSSPTDVHLYGTYDIAATRYDMNDPFRPMLQHVVITWDGTMTSCYVNGRLSTAKLPYAPWTTNLWKKDALLYLGNNGSTNAGFQGTYYLFAIHDRCLTSDEIQRHYQAGPAAR